MVHGTISRSERHARSEVRMIQSPPYGYSPSVPGCGYRYSLLQHPNRHNRYTHPSKPLIRANHWSRHKEVNNRLLYRPNTCSLLSVTSRAKSADALLTSRIRTNHLSHCWVPCQLTIAWIRDPRRFRKFFSYTLLSDNTSISPLVYEEWAQAWFGVFIVCELL